MNWGAWWATVHGVSKSLTRLSDWVCTRAWIFWALSNLRGLWEILFRVDVAYPWPCFPHLWLFHVCGKRAQATFRWRGVILDSAWITFLRQQSPCLSCSSAGLQDIPEAAIWHRCLYFGGGVVSMSCVITLCAQHLTCLQICQKHKRQIIWWQSINFRQKWSSTIAT